MNVIQLLRELQGKQTEYEWKEKEIRVSEQNVGERIDDLNFELQDYLSDKRDSVETACTIGMGSMTTQSDQAIGIFNLLAVYVNDHYSNDEASQVRPINK